jgi:hypothetical protein
VAAVSVYAVNKVCQRISHEPALRDALSHDAVAALRAASPPLSEEEIALFAAADVGRLARMGANPFLLHQIGRWQLLGLDLPTYGERIRAEFAAERAAHG